MKTQFTVALSMLVGAAIGAVAFDGLHAQSTAKAYIVTEVDVLNQEAQSAYLPKVGEVIKSTGGTFLARGGKIVALEGEAPKRVTIVVYDSLEKAQASRNSPAWKALSEERRKAIKARSFVTEGLPN
ncbi:MAG: DUF1330 domain-containing protein [Bradyrhizobium sp.]|nr:DUF1330 domain-containing protein [Bradyrhizobium sp.]